MKIKEFIKNEVFLPRLQKAGVLVVYDPDKRYRAACLEMAGEKTRVVDASKSSILSREEALGALQKLGETNSEIEGLLVYVPANPPLEDEDKQGDPFSIYIMAGAMFPEGDGDEYINICLKAKPDSVTEIRRIFSENPNPSFSVIDAVGGGRGWPTLQAALRKESVQEILFSLLEPNEKQTAALKEQKGWVSEAKELFLSLLGLKLLTRAKGLGAIADELWRFILFSEFVFDLPVDLPDTLANVPKANPEAQPLVENLCDRLRNDQRTQSPYIERAESIEVELNLAVVCQRIKDLGIRDTFPFEERSFFQQAVDALKTDDINTLRKMLERHQDSVWVGRGENHSQWMLLKAGVSLIESCEDVGRQLPKHVSTMDLLIDFYTTTLRDVDKRQREFEQSAGDYIDPTGQMTEVKEHARNAYQRLIADVQSVFIRHFENTGWPPLGRLANVDTFDKFVAPKLEESGNKVAVLLIDALRFELGVELQKQLTEYGRVELQPAFAQLPTVTTVGMASLLPGTGEELTFELRNNKIVPIIDGQAISNVAKRMDVLKKIYGQRFAETSLDKFIKDKFKIPDTVELLVIRSNELDNDFETNPDVAPGLISRNFQRIGAALYKLQNKNFQDAVILTDHGFYLNAAGDVGNVCEKPAGNWINVHERLLLGDGSEDNANFVLSSEKVSIRGEINSIAGPKSLVPYRAGGTYLHGGVSLQETLVPVISVRLREKEEETAFQPVVKLMYKRGATKITTRLPVIDLEVFPGTMFAEEMVDILVEAHDSKGNVVGQVIPGENVNPAAMTLSLTQGESVKVTIKMDMEYEGKFILKALDPSTFVEYDKLKLETDYTV